MVDLCASQGHACFTDNQGESWVSLEFLAERFGLERKTFVKKIREKGMAFRRHILNENCVALSDIVGHE